MGTQLAIYIASQLNVKRMLLLTLYSWVAEAIQKFYYSAIESLCIIDE